MQVLEFYYTTMQFPDQGCNYQRVKNLQHYISLVVGPGSEMASASFRLIRHVTTTRTRTTIERTTTTAIRAFSVSERKQSKRFKKKTRQDRTSMLTQFLSFTGEENSTEELQSKMKSPILSSQSSITEQATSNLRLQGKSFFFFVLSSYMYMHYQK